MSGLETLWVAAMSVMEVRPFFCLAQRYSGPGIPQRREGSAHLGRVNPRTVPEGGGMGWGAVSREAEVMSTESVPTSATLDAVTASSQAPRRARYGALWRGVPRELGFLLLTMPIAIIGLSVLMSLFWTGVGTIVIYVGVFVLVAAFYTARGFGIVELTRLDWAGRPAIPRPVWERPGTPRTFLRTT